ncbi:FadR/GntR family transcriptional regulator [Ureibacillus massiliensis]|nr:GntR family transcriptional regulator [Ureibacillus massiliensis]
MEQETVLYMSIAAELERQIIEGIYKEGDKLPSERELTVEYKVSRNVIRQAITKLREKGLLTVKPGKGAYITELKDSIVGDSLIKIMNKYNYKPEELLEVREELELIIIRKSIEKAEKANIEQLKQINRKIENNTTSFKEFLDDDYKFHMVLAESTQNPIFPILIRSFLNTTDYFSFSVSMFIKDFTDVLNVVTEHHRKLIEAIENKNEKVAVSIMREHMNLTREKIAIFYR